MLRMIYPEVRTVSADWLVSHACDQVVNDWLADRLRDGRDATDEEWAELEKEVTSTMTVDRAIAVLEDGGHCTFSRSR